MYFPTIDPDSLFELAANFDERLKWDKERLLDGKILESTSTNEYNSYIIYNKGRKIPVPLVKQRDYVGKYYTIKNAF